MRLRFFVQPAVAVFLAMRAGLRDAHAGRPPFLWSILTRPASRWSLVREGVRNVRNVIFLAVILDVAYQLTVLRGIYLLELLFTATLLAVVPYILIRGPVSRLLRWARSRRG